MKVRTSYNRKILFSRNRNFFKKIEDLNYWPQTHKLVSNNCERSWLKEARAKTVYQLPAHIHKKSYIKLKL